MTARLRVIAGPHAGFVGLVDTVWAGGWMLLVAGTEIALACRADCEPAPAGRTPQTFGTAAEIAASLEALLALARAGRAA